MIKKKEAKQIKRLLNLDEDQLEIAVDNGWMFRNELSFVENIKGQIDGDDEIDELSDKQLGWLKKIAFRVLNHQLPKMHQA